MFVSGDKMTKKRLWGFLFGRWCEWLEVLAGQEQHAVVARSSGPFRGRFLYEADEKPTERLL